MKNKKQNKNDKLINFIENNTILSIFIIILIGVEGASLILNHDLFPLGLIATIEFSQHISEVIPDGYEIKEIDYMVPQYEGDGWYKIYAEINVIGDVTDWTNDWCYYNVKSNKIKCAWNL